MDTSTLENIAEDYISHQLQQNTILVAKPKNDRKGTDLLAFSEMDDGVKFCRIQSKGRSFSKSENTHIEIPQAYVSNGFIVFLYLVYDERDYELYVFFPSDIEQWNVTKKDEYQLNLSISNAKTKLDFYKFDSNKVSLIRTLIANAETHGEFNRLIYGKCEGVISGFISGNGSGEVK